MIIQKILHYLLLFALACTSSFISTMNIDKPYACIICPKAFTSEQGLSIHTVIHNTYVIKPTIPNKNYTPIRPYQCNKCPKAFITQECFNIHTTIHKEQQNINNKNYSPIASLLTTENLKDKQFLNWAADL